MRNDRTCVVLLSILHGLSIAVFAGPQSVFDFESVEKASHRIVVVEVLDVKQNGDVEKLVNSTVIPCNNYIANCKVLSVLKEQDDTTSPITVRFVQCRDVSFELEGLQKGEQAVLFLKKEVDGQLVFASDQRSKIPVDGYAQITALKDNSVRERIGRQLVEGIDKKSADATGNAINWANTIGYPVPEDRLLLLAERPDANVRAIALTQLVCTGKEAFITAAVNMLLQGDQLVNSYREKLAWSLEESAQKVPVGQANQLAASTNATIARIGIRILSIVGDQSSLPVLIRGLDAEDKDAQYSAVVALSRITGRRGVSWREFMQNSDAEINEWNKWWGKKGETKERK